MLIVQGRPSDIRDAWSALQEEKHGGMSHIPTCASADHDLDTGPSTRRSSSSSEGKRRLSSWSSSILSRPRSNNS
ncbi:hypothetical protein KVT40_003079 [Elsinoe batatas]|uniref:Uncharacterized protein n=1 Tax=Elsinoe batatas TaxID=2601811 RepID=A0A8K0L662_9PEZI|nr:hypothetical protein KVT40_003079 [Elsinoe batatas]